jgi:O-acetyl-ADP-ribose deacetylase (regulator of RNase III)
MCFIKKMTNLEIEVCVPCKNTYEIVKTLLASSTSFHVNCISITNASHSCIATAGNSFGGMSGGVDGIINTHLSSYTPNEYVQSLVKSSILYNYLGEIPVGVAIAIVTKHPRHKVLIYAPTMRIPEKLPHDTIAPYLAYRAVFATALKYKINKISIPLFGTGAGEVSLEKSCSQMLQSYESLVTIPEITMSAGELTFAHEHHRKLLDERS